MGAANDKYCRPVMPETVVNLSDGEEQVEGAGLLLIYAEDATKPFPSSQYPDNPRINGCKTNGSICIATRGRTEFRLVGSRPQAIQVRGMGGTGEKGRDNPSNPIIGNLRWDGPAYPNRATIDCDLANLDPRSACQIVRIEATSETGDTPSVNSRHDQCRPNSFSTSSMLSFTQVGRP